MRLKIAAYAYVICLLNKFVIHTAAEMNMVDVIRSLKDAQELIDAYNDHDYVKAGIKLIDIKLKADSPKKDSPEERMLLASRERLVGIHPYYLTLHDGIRNGPKIESVKDLNLEDVIEQVIQVFDSEMYQMGVYVDNLKRSGKIATK